MLVLNACEWMPCLNVFVLGQQKREVIRAQISNN